MIVASDFIKGTFSEIVVQLVNGCTE